MKTEINGMCAQSLTHTYWYKIRILNPIVKRARLASILNYLIRLLRKSISIWWAFEQYMAVPILQWTCVLILNTFAIKEFYRRDIAR